MHSSAKKTKIASFGTLKSGPKLFKISVIDGQILIIYYNNETNNVIIRCLVDEHQAFEFLEESL